MADLTSVVLISFLVGGSIHESEIHLEHRQCVRMADALTLAINGSSIPTVEMINGSRAPMLSAECLPACMADGEPLELIALAE